MNGLWLVSYIVLWAMVALIALAMVGVLRELGAVRSDLAQQTASAEKKSRVPPVELDGPLVGSEVPRVAFTALDGARIDLGALADRGPLLLMFLNPRCSTCQDTVAPLNTLLASPSRPISPVIFMRADEEGCRAFVEAFGCRVPVICDRDAILTSTNGIYVQRNPFGLWYEANGLLRRKAVVRTGEELGELIREELAPLPPVIPHLEGAVG